MIRSSRCWGGLFVAGVLAGAPEAPAQEPTTVLVVRHTEKVSEASDAVLSDLGLARAIELQRVTAEARVSVLFASQYARAQQTLEPIADRLGLEILVHDAADSDGLAKRILTDHAGEVILVSGHSNTVTAIVAALGAPQPPPVEDWDYDDLFVVTIGRGGDARVVHLSYGAPSTEP
ncbi:MAG: histidine phosphatase family protein [Gemmatimonadetes bacterium]|nr:histidine phosphatase family protein [Gemmatimonadota bacterium]